MLTMALTMAPTVAFGAKWMSIGTTDSATFFLDTDSIQTSGDSKTFWTRSDYFDRDKYGDLSVKSNQTINCSRREVITRYRIYYDDLGGNGRVTTSGEPPNAKWLPIAPGTVTDGFRKWVCPSK